jgi:Tfp pilus assembly protein PilF
MRRLLVVFVAVVCAAGLLAWAMRLRGGRDRPSPTAKAIELVDVSAEAGIDFLHESGARGELLNPETFGPGAGWFDHDGDGRLDLLLVNGNALRGAPDPARVSALYRNLGEGRFEDVTAAAGLASPLYGMGFAAADADNDGDQDLLIYGLRQSRFYLNDGRGRFRDASVESGLGASLRGWVCAAAFFDYDLDGLLDLFVGNYVDWRPELEDGADCSFGTPAKKYCPVALFPPSVPQLFRGRGDGRFEETTAAAGLAALRGKVLGVVVEDYDGDGDPDLFVANDSVPNFLLRNRGDGSFEDRGLESGFATDGDGAALAGMGIDAFWGDDGGPLAVGIGNFAGEPTTLHVQDQVEFFVERSMAAGIGGPTLSMVAFGLVFEDFDLDGRLDIAIANGHVFDVESVNGVPYRQRPQLFRGQGPRSFVELRSPDPASFFNRPLLGRALAAADYDGDGDVDFVLTENQGRARLFRNQLAGPRRFLRVDLQGTRSNRDGIGAEVALEVEEGGRRRRMRRTRRAASSYLSQCDRRIVFGLGERAVPRRLELRWPSGLRESIEGLREGMEIRIVEGSGAAAAPATPGAAGALGTPGLTSGAGAAHSIALRQRGVRLLGEGQTAAALECLDRAVAQDGHDFAAHRFRLIALWRLQRRNALESAIAEAARAFPDAGLLVGHFAVVLRESGHRELAERVFEEAARLDPERADVWMDLGNLAFDRGDREAALARYERVLSRRPDAIEALTNAGMIHTQNRDFTRARARLERALELKADHAPALAALGAVLLAEGRLGEAEAALLSALSHASGRETRVSAHGNLGILYIKRRERARAEEQFEKVLELDPDDAQAKKALARLREDG